MGYVMSHAGNAVIFAADGRGIEMATHHQWREAVIVPLQARKQAAMVSTVRKQPRAAPGQPYRMRSRRCKSQHPVTQDVLHGLQPGQTLPGNRLIARDVFGIGRIAAGAP